MPSKNYTHRVIRGFPLDGVNLERGQLVSSEDWTWQGKIYAEARGWVEPLSAKDCAYYAAEAEREEREAREKAADKFVEEIAPTDAEIVAETKVVRKAASVKKATAPKKAPVKKATPKAKATEKTTSSPKKPVNSVAKKVAQKSPQK